MTIWLLAQEGKKPRLIPMVERHVRQQELVPQWTAEELIANVYAELAQESLSAREMSARLSHGELAFTGSEQSEVITDLNRAVEALHGIIRRIGLWLSTHGNLAHAQ
jgi:hypothetical protein